MSHDAHHYEMCWALSKIPSTMVRLEKKLLEIWWINEAMKLLSKSLLDKKLDCVFHVAILGPIFTLNFFSNFRFLEVKKTVKGGSLSKTLEGGGCVSFFLSNWNIDVQSLKHFKWVYLEHVCLTLMSFNVTNRGWIFPRMSQKRYGKIWAKDLNMTTTDWKFKLQQSIPFLQESCADFHEIWWGHF